MLMWEILPGKVWQGDIFSLVSKFDCCISCTTLSELMPPIVERFPFHIFFPFEDTDHLPDPGILDQLAITGKYFVDNSKTLLVQCNAGRNRSGLVIGMILLKMGYTDVVKIIQGANPKALDNQTFVNYLNSLE